MNRKISILVAMTLLATMPALAQNYKGVVARNFWNDGSNITGIRQDTLKKAVSYAEAFASFKKGDFRSSSDYPVGWTAGARAASMVHLKNFSMKGAFSFEQLEGYDMKGSMLITPLYYPVDVLEFTPGRKERQTYSFDGGVSVDVGRHWRIGAMMDFKSVNYSKRKDLRYTNYGLDMKVAPGIMWHNGSWALGLDFIYRKNGETPVAEQIGTGETQYDAFLDKGLYYGEYQLWTGSGVHLSEPGVTGFPIREHLYGAGFQMQHGNAYWDIEYQRGNGSVGEKEQVWFRFPSHNASWHFGDMFKTGTLVHTLKMNATYRRMDNYETILEKVSENGITSTIEYGSNKIFTRENTTLNLDYTLASSSFWSLKLYGGVIETISVSSTMYPYKATQRLDRWFAGLAPRLRFGAWDVTLGLRYAEGRMEDSQKTVSDKSGVLDKPYRLDSYQIRYREHMTVVNLTPEASVKYGFKNGLYVAVDGYWQKGLEVVYLAGSTRYGASLRFGYDF